MNKRIKNIIRKMRVDLLRCACIGRREMRIPSTAILIAPHPDDEVFGCCGLMQRMLAKGKRVELIVMTGGGKSHSGCCTLDEVTLIAQRRKLTLKAAALYGLSKEHIHFLDFPDGGVSKEHPEVVRLRSLLEVLLRGCRNAAVVYPHRQGEGWPDHIHTAEIVADLCKEQQAEVKQYEYCVWFWFYNCWRIDWRNARILRMDKREYRCKQEAINAYILPKAPCGKPWSGVLPEVFVEANRWKKELYFEVI